MGEKTAPSSRLADQKFESMEVGRKEAKEMQAGGEGKRRREERSPKKGHGRKL